MEALEVGALGLVAGLDQGLEACRDQGGHPAAEHDLLAEEVRLGLFGEGGVEHAGPGAAVGVGVAERQGVGLDRGVLVDGDQRGDAAALGVGPAHEVARALRGDHGHVDAGRRDDLAVADVEPVGEHEHVAVVRFGAMCSS